MALLERAPEGRVTVESEGTGNAVKIDGSIAFIVTEGDVDTTYGETVATATAAAVEQLELAIEETREARDARRMLANATWAAARRSPTSLRWWRCATSAAPSRDACWDSPKWPRER